MKYIGFYSRHNNIKNTGTDFSKSTAVCYQAQCHINISDCNLTNSFYPQNVQESVKLV